MIHAADVAESQVGIAERTGKNDGIPAERYMKGDEIAWCSGFVLFCFEASDDGPLTKSLSTWYLLRSVSKMIAFAQARGWFFARGTKPPQRNDIVFFGDTASDVGVAGSHVGIVVGVDGDDVLTVEGNSGNKVARRRYPKNHRTIVGYARVAR